MVKLVIFVLFTGLSSICFSQDEFIVCSPDKNLEVVIKRISKGEMVYSFKAGNKLIIDDSSLGFIDVNNDVSMPSSEWTVEGVYNHQVDTVWTPVWGKRAVVPEKYNELQIQLGTKSGSVDKMKIVTRVYNDGIAFRYEVPQDGGKMDNLSEITAFNFVGNNVAWFYNGERHNIGPERLTAIDGERLPVMTMKVADDLYLAVHEACLNEGEPLKLKSRKGECSITVSSGICSLYPDYKSAWRVVLCGKQPGDLIDSHLLELLNPEPAEEFDFSWVKPGIALWDWRINGAQWDNFTYTMSYPSWVKMIDFAAEQGFGYLVLDANWYGPEFEKGSDPVKGDKAKDVQRLIRYGKEKGVGVWLYLNDVAGRHFSLEETLKQYEEWGATGVKYGFMTGSAREKNLKTKHVTECCARHKLLVNFHDYPVHPYGQMRTWPNAVTREYCKAQLDGHEIFYPQTFVTSVFVNMIAGPIDMNNGMFDLRQGKTTRVDNNQEVPSTVVSEAARTLITLSGATVIPDIPEYYRKYPALLRFLSAQKMPWLESKTLSGEIGEYIVMMRQANNGTYLIGAATNEQSRVLHIPLSFLPQGKEFEVEIVEDGKDAHYLTNKETVRVSSKRVACDDILEVTLAPGGGACILIVQK